MNKQYTYSVRLDDGRTAFTSENPLTICREWFELKGKGQAAFIASPNRMASMSLYTTVRQNMPYIYVMAHRSHVDVDSCEGAAELIIKAARLDDYEPFSTTGVHAS